MKILRRAAAGCYLLVHVGATAVAAQSVSTVAAAASPAVFRVIAEFGQGSGFLIDSAGLVLTNAHVVAGVDSLAVRINAEYQVPAIVAHRDEELDVAVLRLNRFAIQGIHPLELSVSAYRETPVGTQLIILGFPLRKGVVATTGIVSRKGTRTLLTDASVNPGNSGGPVLDQNGRVLAMATFGALQRSGPGLGGAVTVEAILGSVGSTSRLSDWAEPSADSLAVIPVDDFPLAKLTEALRAEDWPEDPYDISEESVSNAFHVEFVTPPVVVRAGGDYGDLRYWENEVGGPAPVVFARIYPRVGQSLPGFVANVLLGVWRASDDRAGYLPWIYLPEARANLIGAQLQGEQGEFIEPIHRWRRPTVVDGQPIMVLHLIYPADLFTPLSDGSWPELIVNVYDAQGQSVPWVVPAETIQQIHSDFEDYLGR